MNSRNLPQHLQFQNSYNGEMISTTLQGQLPLDTADHDLHFVDLFAGAGGLSLGLEQAGFKPVFVNELNENAKDTYLKNRESDQPWLRNYFERDVKTIVKEGFISGLKSQLKTDFGIDTSKKKSDLDLLVGGPPCQGFSGIGHRRSYSVDKDQTPSNYLYRDMAHIIKELRPKLFLFENVRGLLNSKWSKDSDGKIWDDVLDTFERLGDYQVRWELIHCKDYGIPQNRPRLLLVGAREDLGITIREKGDTRYVAGGLLPKGTDLSLAPPNINTLLSDLVDPSYENGGQTDSYPSDPLNEVQEKLRSHKNGMVAGFDKSLTLTEHKYTRHSEKIVNKFKAMIKSGEIPSHLKTKKFAQRVIPAEWGPRGPNITATSLPDDYVHWIQPRILTVREWARLQTFPDWYEFHGPRTTGGLRRAGNPREDSHDRELPRYTQIGNAVPVQLASIIGHHFKTLLL